MAKGEQFAGMPEPPLPKEKGTEPSLMLIFMSTHAQDFKNYSQLSCLARSTRYREIKSTSLLDFPWVGDLTGYLPSHVVDRWKSEAVVPVVLAQSNQRRAPGHVVSQSN